MLLCGLQVTDPDVGQLIVQLESLRNGDEAVARLIACGPGAIPALREFLLHGKPSGTFQPRCRAVEALAGLRAKDELAEYLMKPKDIADPIARFGEEAVESEAARQLGAWQSEDVFQLLLAVIQGRFLVGAIEALAEFRRPEVMPYFDRALEDDFYRPAAEEAFRKLGAAAREALMLSALTPLPGQASESRSSLRRRKSALGLVDEIGIREEDWPTLRSLIEESDPEIVTGAARLGIRYAGPEESKAITHRLLAVLPAAEWFLQDEIERCLIEFCDSEETIDAEIKKRLASRPTELAIDSALRTLMRVKRRLNLASRTRRYGSGGQT